MAACCLSCRASPTALNATIQTSSYTAVPSRRECACYVTSDAKQNPAG